MLVIPCVFVLSCTFQVLQILYPKVVLRGFPRFAGRLARWSGERAPLPGSAVAKIRRYRGMLGRQAFSELSPRSGRGWGDGWRRDNGTLPARLAQSASDFYGV
ncbi:hypothetical protein [Pseudomonas sp. AN-1]|jgi:hypothetical protein|uniref:hypothetical protein n=1 Tax=Pseudomonas sp. AN-1 TaxID=3096605 RepID=UPI002A69E488|nr:hypothetical protein [Pseudomonas sp. AN-1]WPP45574.1 hypothetical protein SK095_20380 [Pseudomonas sp. AN-1]